MKCNIIAMLYGFMIYWDEVDDAVRYYVHLLIGDSRSEDGNNIYALERFQEIALVEHDKYTKYHSFINLAKIDYNNGEKSGLNYYVYVEAEDRNGNIIGKTSREKVVIETFSNTPRGTLVRSIVEY